MHDMGLQETAKAAIGFKHGRPAVAELLVGPSLKRELLIGEEAAFFSITPLGNSAVVQSGIRVLNALGIQTDNRFLHTAVGQGKEFNNLTLAVYAGLTDEELVRSQTGTCHKVKINRGLAGLYAGGVMDVIVRINWSDKHKNGVEFLPPKYNRGLAGRDEQLDPVGIEFINRCAKLAGGDSRLEYYIQAYNGSQSFTEAEWRICRLFSLLEYMSMPYVSSTLNPNQSRLYKETNDPKYKNGVGSRTGIRMLLRYFETYDIPKFTLWDRGVPQDFEFDHIDVAGKLRDKIFHGGRRLEEQDFNTAKLRPALRLMNERPELIASALRRDCEREIVSWVYGNSRSFRAARGENVEIPERSPKYDGRELTKMYFASEPNPTSPISSLEMRVKGHGVAFVRLGLSP